MAAPSLSADRLLERRAHQPEVRRFLQKHFSIREWVFSLPPGTGRETYFAQGSGRDYFVKLGAPVERYQTLAGLGLTPPVLAAGELESGKSILVQPRLDAHEPSRGEFHQQIEKVAARLRELHASPQIRAILPPVPSQSYQDAAVSALERLLVRWQRCKALVPAQAGFVAGSLERLHQQIDQLSGLGPVASHNDICNANWLFTDGGEIYLVDFEALSLDDPACDLGALLWWYYPPALRRRFLAAAGYRYETALQQRMRLRMAMHCLGILLPREGSFDRFDPENFGEALVDFRAVMEGKENPQGYGNEW